MKRTAIAWIAVGAMFLPSSLHAQQPQQDPQLIGEGSRVYSNSCGRCHNARASTERNDAEWAVVMLHMRARANLTKSQAAAVLAYLQATNLPEGQSTGGVQPPSAPAETAPTAAGSAHAARGLPPGLRVLIAALEKSRR